jgi:Protein of unknown function (DUF664)
MLIGSARLDQRNRRRTEELSVAPDDVIRAYLHRSRDALIWKLDGLSEYDLRRPLTPTGTNLLVFHTDLLRQVLVGLNLVPMFGQALGGAALESPDAGVLLLDHPTE